MKRDVKLYNLIFPTWIIFFVPSVLWLLILPGNFAIDSLVLLLALRHYGIPNKLQIWKHAILRIWLFGFLADFLGAGLNFPIYMICSSMFDAVHFPGAQLVSLPGIAFAGLLINLFNQCFAFKNCGLEEAQIRKLSFALAVFTAPYTMLCPLEWISF